MAEFPWTRLEGTPLWKAAKATYEADPRRRYHVWYHVGRLYHWAAIWGLPYDPALDRAILTHDVLYDERSEKEYRSLIWLKTFTGLPCAEEETFILATINHEITPGGDNRIQLLDLADLGVPELVAPNRELIAQEIMALHGITRREFSQGNLVFFQAMLARYPDSLLEALPAQEAERLAKIRRGIARVVEICQQELAEAE